MVTIQSQNFGVEIEMTGVSRGTAASVIANYFGVGGIHFAGGTYQTYEAKDSKGRVWKCMRDGSITPRRRRGGAIVEADDTYRCEVVTPILQYEDITDLQEVIRALVKKGAMANSSCGIHVHFRSLFATENLFAPFGPDAQKNCFHFSSTSAHALRQGSHFLYGSSSQQLNSRHFGFLYSGGALFP